MISCIEKRLQSQICQLSNKLAWLAKASFSRCVPWSIQCTHYMESHLLHKAGLDWINLPPKKTLIKIRQCIFQTKVFSTWSIVCYEMLRITGGEFRDLYIFFFFFPSLSLKVRELPRPLEETRIVLYVTFSTILWLYKRTNSLHNTKTRFLTSQAGWGVYSSLALAHHCLFCFFSSGTVMGSELSDPTNCPSAP